MSLGAGVPGGAWSERARPGALHAVTDWRPRPTRRTLVDAVTSFEARELLSFSRLPVELQYLYLHSISVPEYGLVFAKNSKAGCTSVAHALRQALCETKVQGRIHEDHAVLTQGYEGWRAAQRAYGSAETFSFTTVREPLGRLVSAFVDVFVEGRNPVSGRHRAAIARVAGDGRASLTARFSRFVAFVEADIARLGPETDRHWRPQVRNIAVDHVRYSRIGRIEELADWLPAVLDATGLRGGAAASRRRKYNASTTPAFTVAPDDCRRLECIFARDYELYEGAGG